MAKISLEDLLKEKGNIFEVVVAMSRRARQINDEQKLQIDIERDVVPAVENRDSEDFDEVEIDREALMREHKKYPKPSRLAIEEMMDEKIEYSIDMPSEEDEEEPET